MRREFADLLYDCMKQDDRIYVLTGDLGYKMLTQIQTDFPSRFANVGAAEQLMLGAAVGLAQEGFIPVCYSITPFALWRPAEWIRNYLNYEKANVKIVGSGRDWDYQHDGFSHYAGDDWKLMQCFTNIQCFWPQGVEEMQRNTLYLLHSHKPAYLNLRR